MTSKFAYLYSAILIALFSIFYFDISAVARVVNEYQTHILLFMLEHTLQNGHIQGIDIIISPVYKVIITKACNGIIPYLVLLSGILAYPTYLKYKITWSIIAYLFFTFINLVRLHMVVYFTSINPDYFWISHDVFGNALLMSAGLLLFYIYLIKARNS